ncbi:MAG: HAD hydrolase-like protein [Rhodocyclaceae bacterium]|nr:HAD hydrolase-like protein [Rhodocyclaceae bacterium]
MSANHTVIFDLDGTLIDSAPGIIAAFSAVLAAHQIQPRVPLNDSLTYRHWQRPDAFDG